MISACFNPSCGRELKYLRDGRVIRIIRNGQDASEQSILGYVVCPAFCFANDKSLRFARRLGVTSHKRQPELRWIVERIAS